VNENSSRAFHKNLLILPTGCRLVRPSLHSYSMRLYPPDCPRRHYHPRSFKRTARRCPNPPRICSRRRPHPPPAISRCPGKSTNSTGGQLRDPSSFAPGYDARSHLSWVPCDVWIRQSRVDHGVYGARGYDDIIERCRSDCHDGECMPRVIV
jgi:hypothetical protein